MSLFPDSNVVYAPKVGESNVFTLTGECRRVKSEDEKGNYKDKNHKDTGYYDVFPVEDGKELKVNAWRLYFALRDAKVDIGDTIEIDHVSASEYKITKID